MNELQKRAFVAGARWTMLGTYGAKFTPNMRKLVTAAAKERYTPKPTCYDCHWQFDNPFDQSFCKKGFKATRVCKQFKKQGAK